MSKGVELVFLRDLPGHMVFALIDGSVVKVFPTLLSSCGDVQGRSDRRALVRFRGIQRPESSIRR